MSRCYREKDIHYNAYGKRGIVVCDEWRNDKKMFIQWALANGYSDRDLKMRYYLTIANTGDADKDCAYLNIANAIDKAIEIVKRGGVDEK